MKKFTSISAAVLTAAVLMSGCGAGSKTAMTAGNVKVTQGDVEVITEAYLASTGDFDSAKKYAVKSIEEAVKIYATAQSKGLELNDDEKAQLRSGKASFAKTFGSTSEYKKILKSKGGHDEIVEMVIAEPLYEQKLLEGVEIAEPSDEEAKTFFKENYRRAKHVLLPIDSGTSEEVAKADAEIVLKKAQEGTNFDDLIKEYSQDPGSQSNPDGYVFTDNQMVEEFDEAVKSIQPGEFTMCKSSYGYHVIQRLSLEEKFDEFFEQNKEAAKTAKQSKDKEDALNKMADEAGIQVEKIDDVINAIPSPTPEATEQPTDAPEEDASTEETSENK